MSISTLTEAAAPRRVPMPIEGQLLRRTLSDGRYVALEAVLPDEVRIVIGDETGWVAAWYYAIPQKAAAAFEAWHPESQAEPDGWTRAVSRKGELRLSAGEGL
jgi:hypothetical protein